MKRDFDIKIIKVTIIIAALLCIGFFFGFIHGRNPWHWNNYMLNTEVVGHYGDFIGGVIGSFVSIILLYYTFFQQRIDSHRNSKVYLKQQINDDFYHLIDLYYNILSTLEFPISDDEGGLPTILKGKEALCAYMKDMWDGFDDTSKGPKRKQAILAYMDFYAKCREFAPVYYRTLYRTCETISNKEKDTDYKNVELIKILRAQLSDSEMVMAYYNAQTRMGNKFKYYANRFNLFKHLPPLELLEYKSFTKIIAKPIDISALNVYLVEIRQRMEEILSEENPTHLTINEHNSSVSIALHTSEQRDSIELIVTRKNSIVLKNHDPYNCIMRLNEKTLIELFKYFLYDCIVLHNFQTYNIRKELTFDNNVEVATSKTSYSFSVKNIEGNAINMTWHQYETRQENYN